jgi:LacI family transcriptional regulator
LNIVRISAKDDILRFVEYLKAKGLFDEKYVALDIFSAQSGYLHFKELFRNGYVPEILISGNDTTALGIMKAVYECGLKIPDDISIVSFNDIPTAQYTFPPLTTVKFYSEFMGETAVDLLRERLEGRIIPKKVVVPSRIILRETCKILKPYAESANVLHPDDDSPEPV